MNRLWKEQVICNIPVQKDSRTKVYTEKSTKQEEQLFQRYREYINYMIKGRGYSMWDFNQEW